MIRIAIFCSGSGSNAEALMQHFKGHSSIGVALLLSNNPEAGALERARRFFVPTETVPRSWFSKDDPALTELLHRYAIDVILLAGFLQRIPESLVAAFPERILNIHPALLPDFGGKGMYGHHVHEAVKAAGKTQTGLTIHLVNGQYDEGKILFQARCPVEIHDSPSHIAARVLEMEHRFYPLVAEQFIEKIRS